MDFRDHSLEWLAGMVGRRQLAARELAQTALDRIDATNRELNAFIAVDGDRAMDAARALDDALARGEPAGPLCGIPLGVKDTEDTIGYRTTYGSKLWADAPIAETDSILVQRLRAAGCIVVGKTNTPELASLGVTENVVFGVTRNPWDLDRTCGGSSGGSAAAVAAGMVPIATGSDGGGSIRIPSSACGLTGFKPSTGRVPDGGPRPVDWPLITTRGVLASSAADVVSAYDVIVGPHPSELRSLPAPATSWLEDVDGGGLPLRIGWSPTLGYAEIDPDVHAVCEAALHKLGVDIVPVDKVFDSDPSGVWVTLESIYNRRTFMPFFGTPKWDERDPAVTRFDHFADNLTALDVMAAEDAIHGINLQLIEVFERVDLLATPTVIAPPPRIGDDFVGWVRHTYPFNLTRSPAGTVNAGFTPDGLPVGLQLVGPQHADVAVLRALKAAEDVLGRAIKR
jgi:aspartyl-tRNA(Asn)/glutamyl-tRNA(Gln) amidotransferase subunit A